MKLRSILTIFTTVLLAACTAHPPFAFLAQPATPPSADVVRLADAAAMTDKARQIFYAAQPVIDTDRTTFDSHCQTQVSRNTVELGCYTSDNHIYILNINQSQLSEEMVVVAAHEMLHAAYAQMSIQDMAALNSQLENAVTQLHSQALAMQLREYRLTEPGQRDNELHSILGTEYAPLDPDLEQYYSQYLTDRLTIVKDAQQFDQAFARIESTLANLRSQMNQLKQTMAVDLRHRNLAAYNALVARLNTLAKQYNQNIGAYNALSRSLLGEELNAGSQ